MAVSLYMDLQVPRAITTGLRLRAVDVMTAFEDGSHELDDAALLDRAASLNRALFTRDEDLLVEAVRRQQESVTFAGVIYAHQLQVSIGRCIEQLELIAKVGVPEDLSGKVFYLPL